MDEMVDQESYFKGHIDAIDIMIKRQQEMKDILIAGFSKVVDIVIDESLNNMELIKLAMQERANGKNGDT